MLKRIIAVALLVCASTPLFAAGMTFQPNAGLDVNMRHQSFETKFGQGHFSEHYPASNIYLGNKFNRYWGVEVGYTQTYDQEKNVTYLPNDQVLGFLANLSEPSEKTYISNLFMQAWNLNLLGFYPVCPKLKTELTGLVGVAFEKMQLSTVPIYDFPIANAVESWSSSRHALLRAGVGVRQMVTKNFGLRAQGIWEDTSKLHTKVPVLLGQAGGVNTLGSQDFYTVKPKNSYLVGAGFFFQLG